jgi:hypothetical protein
MKVFRLVCVAGTAGWLLATAGAQGFNLDIDVMTGPPEGGNGAPGSTFAAAAGQAGFWNRMDAAGPSVPTSLYGLDGGLTSAQMYATGGLGSAGGSGLPINTGDYCLLLNDYVRLGGESLEVQYHFTGFTSGRYLIYTYAVNATGEQVAVDVTVPGALVPVQVATGPMPGNQFILGVTHTVHDLTLTGSAFDIKVHSGQWPYGECNGFQIVAVPEPCSALALAAGISALVRRRRKPQP